MRLLGILNSSNSGWYYYIYDTPQWETRKDSRLLTFPHSHAAVPTKTHIFWTRKTRKKRDFREFYVQKSLFLLRENRIFSTVRTFGREYQILGKEDSRTINRQSGTSKNEDVFTFQLQTTKICVHIFYWNNWNNWNNHAFTQYTAYQSNIHSDMPHHFNYFNYFN